MKYTLPVLSLLVVMITACAPPATPIPLPPTAATPAPTPVPTPAATPLGQTVLLQAAGLYGGPGNVRYSTVTNLPAGSIVNTSASFGDFVQVSANIAGLDESGFVWKNALEHIPEGLPVLDRLQVPWEPYFSAACSGGTYDPAAGTVTFDSVGATEGFYTYSADVEVKEPIRIQIKGLAAKGNRWSAEASNTEWSDIKIVGSTQQMNIRSRADGGTYEIDLPNNKGSVDQAIVLPRNSSGPIEILFDRPADGRPIGSVFSVLDENGQVLRTVDVTTLPGVHLPNGLFPDGKLYFGTDTMNNSSLIIKGLAIGSEPNGRWVEQASGMDYQRRPGLYKLAEGRHVTVGSNFMLDRAIDGRYCQIMQHDFNLANTADFTWKWFWPEQGKYAWDLVDREVELASEHGWRVRAYLGWGSPEAIPDWLLHSSYSRDQYINILQDYMQAVMGHFKGRVQEWVIANEATSRILCNDQSFYDFWYRKIGRDYIKLEFQTARQADPDAVLIFNDGDNHSSHYPPPYNCRDATIKTMQETVTELNAGGAKLVDAVGMEMHLLGRGDAVQHDKDGMIQIMQSFGKLGARVYITEMDVDLNFLQSQYPTQEARWQYQAAVYKDMVDACLESGACDSFSTMDIGDSMSAITTSCAGCPYKPELSGDPTLFDDSFLPKPAYFAVSDSLAGP